MHGSIEHAQALAGAADIRAAEANSGRTALHKAAFWGHGNITAWLIEQKLDVNAQDFNGDSALHDAARFGHAECVKALAAAGADASLKNKKGQTAADVAKANGHSM